MTGHRFRWGKRVFPEIRQSIHTALSAREVALPAPVLAVGVVLLCGLTYLGGWRLASLRGAAERDAAIRRIASANVDLQDSLAAMRDQLALATQNLHEAQQRQAALAGQSELLRDELQSTEAKLAGLGDQHLNQSLKEAQQQIFQLQAQRATLAARLSKVEADRAQRQDEVTQSRDDLDQMRARLGEVQKQLAARESWHRVASAAPQPPASPPPTEDRSAAGRPGLGQIERLLAAAGVDVARLVSGLDNGRSDEGGPFVPPPAAGKPKGQLDAVQLAALRDAAKSLPLSLPMDDYRMTSPFGMRRDPFNGRPAFHPGVDLAAPYGTPIYATAPGTVTYAGWMDGYGKVIDIDDGHGISTRYGHLHGYTVAVGERVETGRQIGYEGSTGRSTGPHVIYEVRVNGEPQDPMKFVALAHLIPAAQRGSPVAGAHAPGARRGPADDDAWRRVDGFLRDTPLSGPGR